MISRTLSAALVLVATSGPLGAADLVTCWIEHGASAFENGIACFHARTWNHAIPWFLRAIEDDGRADVGRYFNLHGKLTTYRYLPYYLAGRSYRELDDCRKAVEYFRKSCDQGQIQKSPKLLRRLNDQSRACWKILGNKPEPKPCSG